MKKVIIGSLLLIGIAGALILIKKRNSNATKAKYSVGILQTASHPALDASRDGFIEELTKLLHNDVEFVIKNAQGSTTQAHAIAQQMRSNKQLNGFMVIATLAAQAMHTVEKERPLFIAAVTNPEALGLIYPDTNVCGTKDMIDIAGQITMLTQLLPQARTVGILYTSGELNSINMVTMMHKELKERGLTAIDFAIGNDADIPAMVNVACRKVDVLLAPTDNNIASAISLVSAIALKHKMPLIVSDNMLVQQGPLASRGVDYRENGVQTAHIAHAVLAEGKKPADLPIEQAPCNQIFINAATMRELGILIPDEIQKDIVFVE